jgi:hypothetical protein
MKKWMRTTMAEWAAAGMLVSAASLMAHHSLSQAQFDTTTGVTVKGTIVLFERVNPHSFIFVDQKGADGQMHRWAIEGPGIFQLTRMGFGTDVLKVGDVIEFCGYVKKEGLASQRTASTPEPISLSLKDKTRQSVSGRILTAEVLVMPDGRRQPWSDYGHHKCFAPDYRDIHVR